MRAISSVGQSWRLITAWSRVQVLDGLFIKKSFHLTAEAFLWWAIQDLNPGPSGYEPPALTN